MVSIANDVMNALRRAHAEQSGEVNLGLFLSRWGELGDDELADLIELDARERLRCGKRVELPRYLEAIPDLPARRVALDAAIEFALRSLSGSRHTKVEAVEALCEAYPDLVPAISAAWFLNDALGSTAGASTLVPPVPEIQVPLGVGPLMSSGRHRYELRERLGKGSHGAVYLAVDYSLSEPDRAAWVAVKVTTVLPGGHVLSHRVREEATKARRVTHPNIARVLDRGAIDEGREFIVYEHVDAGDLQDAHDRGRLPRDHRHLARLVAKVARAVQAAHSAGLIHSDLKPSNVLLTSAGEPKVADFGLAARRFDLDNEAPGVQLGTLGFIAPERYRAEPGSEGVASDVYSLGGILFYLLIGRAPNGATPDEVAERLGADPEQATPLRFETGGAPLDPDLEAICARALAPRAPDRYASADALANDLEAWTEHRALAWRTASPQRVARLFVRRNPVLCAAGVVLGVLALGATVAVMRVQAAETQQRLELEMKNAEALAAEQAQRLELELKSAEALAAEQADSIAGARQMAGNVIQVLMSKRGDMGEEWVAFLTVAESVAGPLLFDPSINPRTEQLWSARIEVARERIDEAKGAGRYDDSDTLLWRVALGFWLSKRKEYAQAATILREAAEGWRARVGPRDTWAVYADVLASCVAIREMAAAGGPPDEAGAQRLAGLMERVADGLPAFTGSRAGNNVHREALEALVVACGPGMLDRASDRETFQKLLADIGG